ncbi:hypothetical protein [Serratia quinivorans]|uniref:hypothetical protein n=1 Tax=Serratia quinivorans TaxID=137545 RepID=UPI003981AB33
MSRVSNNSPTVSDFKNHLDKMSKADKVSKSDLKEARVMIKNLSRVKNTPSEISRELGGKDRLEVIFKGLNEKLNNQGSSMLKKNQNPLWKPKKILNPK